MKQEETGGVVTTSKTHGAADMTRRMVCGGLAGMIAKTATNPLDRIKMLYQTGEHGFQSRQSVMTLYRSIIQKEGIVGLWAGNGTNLLRIFPAKAVVFASNDFYKSLLLTLSTSSSLNDNNETTLPTGLVFLAGGMAGMSATAATYPLDLARGRIAGKLASIGRNNTTSVPHYKGVINTLLATIREEGVRALYKGVTPTILGAMPYEGIKFGTVGLLESFFPPPQNNDNERPSIWRKVAFGGVGGAMAGLITYPNDTIRRMLQLQGSRGTVDVYTGYWDCIRKTYTKFGIHRFYHGSFVNIVRMAPNVAIQFGSYEILKRMTDGSFYQ